MPTSFAVDLGARFEVIGELGRGTSGVTYAVRDLAEGGVRRAAKVVRHAQGARVFAEVSALRSVRCREVAELVDLVALPVTIPGIAERGAPVLVQSFAEGEGLDAQEEAPAEAQLLRWLRDALRGLAALHAAGWAHGDLKPAHLRVAGERAVLVDLSAAGRRGHAGAFFGTPRYAAPEASLGIRDAPGDLFALGATIADVTGIAPRGRYALGVDTALGDGPLGAFLARALAPDLATRFADAVEALEALPGDSGLRGRVRAQARAARVFRWPLVGEGPRTAVAALSERLASSGARDTAAPIRIAAAGGRGFDRVVEEALLADAERAFASGIAPFVRVDVHGPVAGQVPSDAVFLVDARGGDPAEGTAAERVDHAQRAALRARLDGRRGRVLVRVDEEREAAVSIAPLTAPEARSFAADIARHQALPPAEVEEAHARASGGAGAFTRWLARAIGATEELDGASPSSLHARLCAAGGALPATSVAAGELRAHTRDAAIRFLPGEVSLDARARRDAWRADADVVRAEARALREAGVGDARHIRWVLGEDLTSMPAAAEAALARGETHHCLALMDIAAAHGAGEAVASYAVRAGLRASDHVAVRAALAFLGPEPRARFAAELGLREGDLRPASSLDPRDDSAHARSIRALVALARGEDVAPGDRSEWLTSPDGAARFAGVTARIALIRGDLDAAIRIATRAAWEASADSRIALLGLAAHARHRRGDRDAAHRVYSEVEEGARLLGDVVSSATAATNRALLEIEAGRFGEAISRLGEASVDLMAAGQHATAARAAANRAAAQLAVHDLDGAELTLASVPLAPGGAHAEGLAGVVQVGLALARGREGRARAALADVDARVDGWPADVRTALAPRLVTFHGAVGSASRADALSALVPDHPEVRLVVAQRALDAGERGRAHDALVALAEAAEGVGFDAALGARVAGARLARALGDSSLERQLGAAARAAVDRALESLSATGAARLRARPEVRAVMGARTRPRAAHAAPWRDTAKALRAMSGDLDRESLLRRAADAALLATGAERTAVVSLADPTKPSVMDVAPSGDAPEVSRTLAAEMLRVGRPVVSHDTHVDARLSDAASVHGRPLRSVALAPVAAPGATLALYGEDSVRPDAFDDDTLERLGLVAAVLAANLGAARAHTDATKTLERALAAEASANAAVREARDLSPQVDAGLVDESPAMRRMVKMAKRVARSPLPVVIEGPSGAGKERIATLVHAESERAARPFVVQSCAAIPDPLIADALFGHVRGAFSGAHRDREGLLRRADGGTLLLDDAGEMSPALQVALLRVLETGEYSPVGAATTESVDVRVLAASREPLDAAVAAGRFREDLYFRLSGATLSVPALRERGADLPILVARGLEQAGAPGRRVSRDVMARFESYPWPGNVRELFNVLARAAVLADESIELEHLPEALRRGERVQAHAGLKAEMDALAARRVEEALDTHAGNQTRAAEALGLSRYGLQKMMKRLGIVAQRRT